jgi:hypothetical protein
MCWFKSFALVWASTEVGTVYTRYVLVQKFCSRVGVTVSFFYDSFDKIKFPLKYPGTVLYIALCVGLKVLLPCGRDNEFLFMIPLIK